MLLATICACATVLCLAWRAEPFVDRWFRIHEGSPRSPAASRLPARAQIELPDDLHALALQESEVWAQDDLRLTMKEKFLELHTGDSDETWQKVRRSYGIGELP